MLLERFKKEWFLLGMVCAVALAPISAEIGRSGGLFQLGQVTKIGIILVFFLHGLSLSPVAIKSGINNWRLHLYTQAVIFVLYPLLWLLLWLSLGKLFLAYPPFGLVLAPALAPALALGFCYLFTLPSTISTSVAMTGVSKGNIPSAIFNASLSNILGVFLTPLLVQFFIGQMAGSEIEGQGIIGKLNLFDSIGSIAKLLLLPMITGQILRPWLQNSAQRHKKILGNLDKCIILLIVYNAFSDSVAKGIWQDFPLLLLGGSALLCLVILLLVGQLVLWGARCCHLSSADTVTALFCGTTKTLAVGVSMGKILFATEPTLGIILLPIMLYHPIQIFYCAFQASRYAHKN